MSTYLASGIVYSGRLRERTVIAIAFTHCTWNPRSAPHVAEKHHFSSVVAKVFTFLIVTPTHLASMNTAVSTVNRWTTLEAF